MKHTTPKFGSFVTWGACSRCGARVKYSTLARERLTGLLVCTRASGRPTRPCLDPWPEVYDFQVSTDRSVDPPPEPLPARWMLDDIFSAGTYNSVAAGTPGAYANAPRAAPDDATRLRAFIGKHFQNPATASFESYRDSLNQAQTREAVTVINPATYDGTFVPSASVRTVTPPNETAADVAAEPASGIPITGVPWSQAKGI